MWRFGAKPVFPQTPQEKTREQANADLVQALHSIANIELRKVANSAKKVANADISERNARIAELEQQLRIARPAVQAATTAAPGVSVTQQTANTINKIIGNISAGQRNINKKSNNNVKSNLKYNTLTPNNKAKINAALARRRRNVSENIISKVTTGGYKNASLNNRYQYLTQANKNYIAKELISTPRV
jgi:hypothetical protein